MNHFKKAIMVWGSRPQEDCSQFLGFYTKISTTVPEHLTFAIAARSYYRLFINGEFICHGPARNAEHHLRIDEIPVTVCGETHIAIEVLALDRVDKYCNDCTLEKGVLTAEILDEAGNVLAATGDDSWKYTELTYRRMAVETLSHSRGILEWNDLEEDTLQWRVDGTLTENMTWAAPVPVAEDITYLVRRAPYATYQEMETKNLIDISDMIPQETGDQGFTMTLIDVTYGKLKTVIPEENQFLKKLRFHKNATFTGKFQLNAASSFSRGDRRTITVTPGRPVTGVLFENKFADVGFVDFMISVKEACILDLDTADHVHASGEFRTNTYVTRYTLQPGTYHLTTFEPKITRFIKFILHTEGEVTFSYPTVLQYTYPDDQVATFVSSDNDLNRIYEASRRTLRVNTLDIFMDCPQRERAGWLCDSQFTARGAWQMFGDLSVERDFLENFIYTDADKLWKSFFPGVYPRSNADETNADIRSWSFWYLAQLNQYYQRSGDREFIDFCQDRVARFVEGFLTLRGTSGLLENIPELFVDWSLANRTFALEPISIPVNCLAVRVLEEMSVLYNRPDWKKIADEMRAVIESLPVIHGIFGQGGDAADVVYGRLRRTGCPTEAGIALELWSGFHLDDKEYIDNFVNAMGPCPIRRPNPNIGKANVTFGMLIRFEVLAKLGRIDVLMRELKDLYLEQLKIGSGVLFENINTLSGCQAINADVGALISQEVLGVQEIHCGEKVLHLRPCVAGLRWAYGTVKCEDGLILVKWSADHEDHVLDITVNVPDGWQIDFIHPFSLNGWTVNINDRTWK